MCAERVWVLRGGDETRLKHPRLLKREGDD